MATEPESKSAARRVPRARYRDDGFVVQEADGFASLTPEQRARPLDPLFPGAGTPPRPDDSPAGGAAPG